jgi:thioredoxin 1
MSEITILKFSSSWCGPCKKLQTYLPEVVAETGVCVHSYDADEHEKKFEEFGVRAVPTLIFLKKDLEIGRKTGLIPREELIRLIGLYRKD